MSVSDILLAEAWAARLGLAFEPMFGETELSAARGHHVLLDGADGSFALSTEPVLESDALDWTWSAGLRHHVLVQGDQVFVRHLGREGPARAFERNTVAEQLDRFFDLLIEEKAYPKVDVIDHLMRTFRSHREFCRRIGEDELVRSAEFYATHHGEGGVICTSIKFSTH